MRLQSMLFVVAVLSGWLCAGAADAVEHTKDSLATVKQKLANHEAVLVDVREQAEWDAGHIDAAVLVPLSTLQRDAAVSKKLAKDKVVYTHCKIGVRSVTAAEILLKQGYDVRPLKAGYQELLNSGFTPAKVR